MEKSFKLTMDIEKPDAVRAELLYTKADGRTVISIAMTVPNEIAAQTVAQAQAEVLRMAISDLEQERAALLAAR